jgi:hypothetical protein
MIQLRNERRLRDQVKSILFEYSPMDDNESYFEMEEISFNKKEPLLNSQHGP